MSITARQAAEWFVNRLEKTPMPGAREMFQLAAAALQEKAEREDPKPLTLEELRRMDGEPVYIVYAFAEPSEWVVFDHHNDDGFGTKDNCWWFAKGYGTAWEAYGRKPKEVS